MKRDRQFTNALVNLSNSKKIQKLTSDAAATAHGLANAARTNRDTLLGIPIIERDAYFRGLLEQRVVTRNTDASQASTINSNMARSSIGAERVVRELLPARVPRRRRTVDNAHHSNPHPSGHRRSRSLN